MDKNDLENIFKDQVNSGAMNKKVSEVIINNLNDSNIAGCIGVEVDELSVDDITVVSIILDASGSMNHNEQAVRDGYDSLINSLKESKQSDSMIVSSRVFSSDQKILYGFTKVEEIKKIGSDYTAEGRSTSLYDTLVNAMTDINIYSKNLNDNGIRTKNIIIVFSDGEDNSSRKNNSLDVKTVSDEFLKLEQYHLVYVGFQNDPNVSLDMIAKEIGFPNILTAKATEHEIRQTMNLVSKSIIKTSQSQINTTNTFFN